MNEFYDSVIVDSINTTLIDGQNLKTLHISIANGIVVSFGPQLMERIGSTGYFFPAPHGSEEGRLRCYTDSAITYINTNEAPSCDYLVTGINENENVSYLLSVTPTLF